MKARKNKSDGILLEDQPGTYGDFTESMVRTQIYLTRSEHEFLQAEAGRRGENMSAVLRGIIDEKMSPPEDAWTKNPMLDPNPEDPEWKGSADGSINHDHYVYGGPKKYAERDGNWVKLALVDE